MMVERGGSDGVEMPAGRGALEDELEEELEDELEGELDVELEVEMEADDATRTEGWQPAWEALALKDAESPRGRLL